MSSREAILGTIRKHLAGEPPLKRPTVPEVWAKTGPTVDQMAQRFITELGAVSGEAYRFGSIEAARAKLAELLGELDAPQVGVMDRPLCRELIEGLPEDQIEWPATEGIPDAMEALPAALIEADCLLADTGSSMIACATPGERLLCYLPPLCIVIGRTGRLFEHMPAAWEEIAPRAADPELRGEYVFITGPSRTADIEKILILGVHGPKRLVVLLVD